jgi:hypothetical protein
MNILLNNEGHKCTTGVGVVSEGYKWEERVNGEGKGGQTLLIYFICMYENRTLKPMKCFNILKNITYAYPVPKNF